MAQPSYQSSLFEAEAPPFSWQKIVTPAALEAMALNRGQIIEFLGHRGLFALGHHLMAWRMAQEESVLLVDGANMIDLPLVLRLTDGLKTNKRQPLSGIYLSRAFTVHQLEAVISDRLEEAFKKYQSSLCFVSGLLETFYDEEVPFWETTRILKRVTEKLRALADQGHRLIVLAPDPPLPAIQRRNLTPLITKISDRIFSLTEDHGQFILADETKTARYRQWVLPSFQLSIKRPLAR